MRITKIDRIDIDMPYQEQVVEHLRKGWGFGNRATDEEFASQRERFEQEFRGSRPPRVRTALYLVHTDDGLTGLGEGAALDADQLAGYEGRSPFEYINDDGPGPLQIAFYDLMGQAVGLPLARLLGPARDTAPLAWWSHCFPPEVLRAEAERALAAGLPRPQVQAPRPHRRRRAGRRHRRGRPRGVRDHRRRPTRPSAPSSAPSTSGAG